MPDAALSEDNHGGKDDQNGKCDPDIEKESLNYLYQGHSA